ncbi:hypothetical protein L226DRAFT_600380 [Lentinus tigrinus ALCF2SS1-7]|uniref:uncharacterized protein n=1 Tax=Lentinus tigrinus ALCF2SS1-7 TaxID=1328758 RepID=UPI001165F436|nr:hypothetical protein L226DRAFT_600380 [Lentinus tigrinus ALCF2SS1-7]
MILQWHLGNNWMDYSTSQAMYCDASKTTSTKRSSACFTKHSKYDMNDLPPLPSFDERNGLRGRFQTHRATSTDSPYDIVHTVVPAANKEHSPSPSSGRQIRRHSPAQFEGPLSTSSHVGSGGTIQEDISQLRGHVGNDTFTPRLSPGPRTPDGGIREGDNWHSKEAIREESRGTARTIRKLRKTKNNECRLKEGLDKVADRMTSRQ